MKLPFLSGETDNTKAHPSTSEGNVRRKLLLERKNKVGKQDRSVLGCAMKNTVTVTRMAGKTMGRGQKTKEAYHRVTWEQGQLQLSSGCDRGPLQRFEQGRMMGLQPKCQQKPSGCELTIYLEY